MPRELSPYRLSLDEAAAGLAEFRQLLDGSAELSEGIDLLPFFIARPDLAALVGSIAISVHRINAVADEFDLFGNFRCDWCVGDSAGRSYAFVEFEDARANSVFADGPKYHAEWGRRFEHGFSQLVDWFWAVDQYRDTIDFQRRFGTGPVQFVGILVIGRRRFLSPDQVARLRWRVEKVWVNGHKVYCQTFDDLYDHLAALLHFYRSMVTRGDSP